MMNTTQIKTKLSNQYTILHSYIVHISFFCMSVYICLSLCISVSICLSVSVSLCLCLSLSRVWSSRQVLPAVLPQSVCPVWAAGTPAAETRQPVSGDPPTQRAHRPWVCGAGATQRQPDSQCDRISALTLRLRCAHIVPFILQSRVPTMLFANRQSSRVRIHTGHAVKWKAAVDSGMCNRIR